MRKRKGKLLHLSFNKLEILWLIAVLLLLSVAVFVAPDVMFENADNTFIVICSAISIVSSPVCELLISKQSRYWTLFSLFFVEIPDIVILFGMGLYSSAFLSLFFWIPFDLMTFVTWSGKNIDDNNQELTKVKSFKPLHSVFLVLGMFSLGVLIGAFVPLTAENFNPYTVAFSNVFEIANGIFLLTRHSEQWFAWLGYLCCEIIIWITLGHYVMLITVFAMLTNTIYGLIKWHRYAKQNTPSHRTDRR